MYILCPHCNAKFSLPHTLARNNALLRCSLCQTVFPIEEGLLNTAGERMSPSECANYIESIVATNTLAELDSLSIEQPVEQNKKVHSQKKSSKNIFIVLACIILLILGFYFIDKPKNTETLPTSSTSTNTLAKLAIQDLRQYYISNNKNTKPFFVIEGKILNNDSTPKANIVIKAALLSKKNIVVAEQERIAGVLLSPFQLKTLSQKEMEAILQDPVEIAATNNHIPPQKTVPFTILFFDPPKDVVEFTVQVVSASEPRE